MVVSARNDIRDLISVLRTDAVMSSAFDLSIKRLSCALEQMDKKVIMNLDIFHHGYGLHILAIIILMLRHGLIGSRSSSQLRIYWQTPLGLVAF